MACKFFSLSECVHTGTIEGQSLYFAKYFGEWRRSTNPFQPYSGSQFADAMYNVLCIQHIPNFWLANVYQINKYALRCR